MVKSLELGDIEFCVDFWGTHRRDQLVSLPG